MPCPGERPTLVLIHGLVGSLDYFAPAERIPEARVLAPDLLGYGSRREVPTEDLSLAAQAERVARVIDRTPGGPLWLLGHSMGGAVAVLAAQLRRERIAGLIDVEGNLTERDCYWSGKIARKPPGKWERSYARMAADPEGFLVKSGVAPTPERVAWTAAILAFQPASTVRAMSGALVGEGLAPSFLRGLRRLLDGGLELHLLAGERSAADWGVPDFVRGQARSYAEIRGCGHLMMLEAPDRFCRAVARLLS